MPKSQYEDLILLPELRWGKFHRPSRASWNDHCEKISEFEVCPKCATPCSSVYDHRRVKIKDAPIRGKGVWLIIRKRRFWCKTCNKPFTEPVQGILPRKRSTQRYQRGVVWACENFSDLKRVQKAYRCSADYIYRALYEQLERKRKRLLCPWPKTIGIDEHSFRRHPVGGWREFATTLIDYNRKCMKEVVHGKSIADLKMGLNDIEGRENVKNVICDLADPYKRFAKEFFPNAQVIADKFHVLRLLHPAINKARKEITGDRRTLPIRKLLLKNGKKLQYDIKRILWQWLEEHPQLKELYGFKEAMHGFYRIKGYNRAKIILNRITDRMANSKLPEIKRLRKTLMRWRQEILNYFKTGLTNGRTEGFNNRAKLIKRRAYGYKNFNNYRLRLLNACNRAGF